jgi:uncharacterized small protein (DUF1192 family)
MDFDDLKPIKKKAALRDLAPLSVEELGGYIAELEAEITRARQAIAAKQSVRAGADALFKS